MVELTIFVEGNYKLRQGFDYLFADSLKGRKVFNMSNGKTDAVKKFNAEDNATKKAILIDLDGTESDRDKDIKRCEFKAGDKVYYMVQEMEAWFLSQPEILDKYYNLKISHALKSKYENKHASEIGNPKSKLKNFIKEAVGKGQIVSSNGIKRKNYDEINDAVALLKKLNLDRLKNDFSDVKALINLLN